MASAPSRRTGEDHGVRTQAGRTAAANSGERSAGRLLRRFPAGSDRAGIRAPHDRRSDEHDGAPEPLAAGGGPGREGAAVRRRDRPLLRGAPGQRVPDESLQHGAGGPARLSPGPRDPRPGDETGDRAGRPAPRRVPGLPVRRARCRSGHGPRVHRMRRHVPRGHRSARETARRGAGRPVGRRHHQVRGQLGKVPQSRLQQVDGVRAAEPAALPARHRVHRPAAGHRCPGGPRLAAGPQAAPGVRAGNRGCPGCLRPRKRTRAPRLRHPHAAGAARTARSRSGRASGSATSTGGRAC